MKVLRFFLLSAFFSGLVGADETGLPAGKSMDSDHIGRAECARCHPREDAAWVGSDHDLAMQEATPETVLGDFNDVEFEQFGVVSRFYRKDGRFMVRTDGPDGEMADFPIRYTFGVAPLQQYLIEFPGGRLQALDIAWDSRPKDQGGQRWFHLHGDERIAHDDVLHWTGPNLNWNFMCADCHSTRLKKNYDAKTDSYRTNWSEIDVSCEACHGPGSEHRRWAESESEGQRDPGLKNKGLTVDLTERAGIGWRIDADSGKPQRSEPLKTHTEVGVCARCHSRRSQLSDDHVPGQPFMDAFRPALLTQGLYFPDGQMQDEVYVWGSFLQSKMYQFGVTCSDCHDPHSGDLRLPGDQVCSQCHAADRYATRNHHFHAPDQAGASCVECHMSPTVFMGVDARHDHGFRVPRPDISVRLGTPNACNRCHDDQSAQWAAEQAKSWYGHTPKGSQNYGPLLAAARQQRPAARKSLQALAMDDRQPAIARATALSELAPYLAAGMDRRSAMLLQQSLNAEDPLLRLAGVDAAESLAPRQRMLALPALWDERLAVRIAAARVLAALPREQLRPQHRQQLDQGIAEYIKVQEFNGERPESQFNLGGLYADSERYREAEMAYRNAARLQPQFVPTYVNMAQLLSGRGREQEADGWLRRGIAVNPGNGSLHHALGLSLIRQKSSGEALQSLAKAADLAPETPRYSYVYAVALQSEGKIDQALQVLETALERHPADIDTLFALVTFNRDAGHIGAAREFGSQLQALLPTNPAIASLIEGLEQPATKSQSD